MSSPRNSKRQPKTQPTVERLDLRLAPASISMAAVLTASLKVERRQVHHLQVSLQSAQPGSRHENMLISRIAAEERQMTRQEVRLDRIEAPAGGTGGTGSQTNLPGNVAASLNVIYNAYEQDPAGFPANVPSTDGANLVQIQGSSVGIQVHDGNPGDFSTLLTELQNAGMQVTTSSAQYGLIVGMLPISDLPTVAHLPEAPGVTPLMRPMLNL